MTDKPWKATTMLHIETDSREDMEAALAYFTEGEWEVWEGPTQQGDVRLDLWGAVVRHVHPESTGGSDG